MEEGQIAENEKLSCQVIAVLQSACRLHEALLPAASPGSALEKVVEALGEVVRCRSLLGVVLLEDDLVIEVVWWESGNRRRFAVPVPDVTSLAVDGWGAGNRNRALFQAIRRFASESDSARAAADVLERQNLLAYPLESSDRHWGFILLEPTGAEPPAESLDEAIGGYVRLAALCIEMLQLNGRSVTFAANPACQEPGRSGPGEQGIVRQITDPLTTISAQAQLLLRSLEEGKPRQAVETIIGQAERISAILSDPAV